MDLAFSAEQRLIHLPFIRLPFVINGQIGHICTSTLLVKADKPHTITQHRGTMLLFSAVGWICCGLQLVAVLKQIFPFLDAKCELSENTSDLDIIYCLV